MICDELNENQPQTQEQTRRIIRDAFTVEEQKELMRKIIVEKIVCHNVFTDKEKWYYEDANPKSSFATSDDWFGEF